MTQEPIDYPAPESTTGFVEVPSPEWAKKYGVTEASDLDTTVEEDRALNAMLNAAFDNESEELADDFPTD